MTDQNSGDTLASMLSDVVKWVPEACGFRGDDRYHAVTAVLSIEDADSLNDKLQDRFSQCWEHTNLEDAVGAVQKLVMDLQGMRPGQLLYTVDIAEDMICYAALWPWNNGKRVSLRLGVHATDMENPGLDAAMTAVKQATGIQGPVPDKNW